MILAGPIKAQTAENRIANSFAQFYKKTNPALRYSYNESKQIHDYSGNWDLDGDKTPDSISFIGNGGAHLYFYPRIVLSSDKKIRELSFIVTDLPILASPDLLKKQLDKNALFPKFVAEDFTNDGITDIYLNTDIKFSDIPREWKKKGVTSRHLLITSGNKDLVVKNFSN